MESTHLVVLAWDQARMGSLVWGTGKRAGLIGSSFLSPRTSSPAVGTPAPSAATANCIHGDGTKGELCSLYHPPETKTENILSLVDSLSGVEIVQVDTASGGWHSHALTDDGEQVVCMGIRGEHGRLRFGDDKSSKMVPQKVQLLMGANIVQLNWLAKNENKNIIEYLVEALIQWH